MEERIDNYITGKMTPDEVLHFRMDLNSDMRLREEYEKAKELADAIQRKALEDKLIQEESKGRASRFNWQTIVFPLAAAASLAMFVMSGSSFIISNHLKGTSAELYEELEAPTSRSANAVDELLGGVYESIGLGELSNANRQLDAIDTAIDEGLKEEYPSIEQQEYQHSLLSAQREEAEWYRAIILMRKGKVAKSKVALKKIVKEGGAYAEKAKALLDTKFNL